MTNLKSLEHVGQYVAQIKEEKKKATATSPAKQLILNIDGSHINNNIIGKKSIETHLDLSHIDLSKFCLTPKIIKS